jgi:hypothetical protein
VILEVTLPNYTATITTYLISDLLHSVIHRRSLLQFTLIQLIGTVHTPEVLYYESAHRYISFVSTTDINLVHTDRIFNEHN